MPGSGWDPADSSSRSAREDRAVLDVHDRLAAVRWELRPDPGP